MHYTRGKKPRSRRASLRPHVRYVDCGVWDTLSASIAGRLTTTVLVSQNGGRVGRGGAIAARLFFVTCMLDNSVFLRCPLCRQFQKSACLSEHGDPVLISPPPLPSPAFLETEPPLFSSSPKSILSSTLQFQQSNRHKTQTATAASSDNPNT